MKMNYLKSSFIRLRRFRRLPRLAFVLAALGMVILPAAASALAAGDVGSWTSTSNLSVNSTTAGAVVYNGFLYNVGGRDNSLNAMDQVQYAPINPDGTVGTWTTSPNVLPTAQWRLGVVENNGYLYSIGGLNGGGAVAGVYYAPINPDGSVGTWTSTTSLPQATHSSGVVVYSGHIFIFGGATSSNVNTVLSAPINPDGTVGTWTTTTSLPQAERRQKAIEYNGYVYLIGGLASSDSTAIYSAKLNSDGTVGTWTTLPVVLPAAIIDFSVAESSGYVYLVGGNDGTNLLDSVYFAPLNGDGTMGSWTAAANALPVGEEGTSTVASSSRLYVLGGDGTSSSAFATVYYASLTVASGSGSSSQAASSSNDPSGPDTGYGAPKSNLLITVIMTAATVSVGIGFRLLRRPKQTAS